MFQCQIFLDNYEFLKKWMDHMEDTEEIYANSGKKIQLRLYILL